MTLSSRLEGASVTFELSAVLSAVGAILGSADGGIRLRELTEQATEALGFATFSLCSLEHTTLVLEASSHGGPLLDWRSLDAVRAVTTDAPSELQATVLTESACPGAADLTRIAAMGLGAVVVVPLVTSGRCVGALAVGAVHGGQAAPTVIAALRIVAAALASVIDRRRRALMTHAGDAVFLHGDGGVVIDVNDEACMALGLPRSALVGRLPMQFDTRLPEAELASIGETLARQGMVDLESAHRHASGRVYPVEVRLRRLYFGDREYTVSVARDITRRKAAEEALARSEGMMQRAQRMGQIGSWVCDLETRTVTLSAEAARLRGLVGAVHPSDVLLDHVHPDDLAAMRPLMQAAQLGVPFETEYRLMVNGEGQCRHLRTIVEPERDASGTVVRLVGITHDITARHDLESQLRHAQKQEVIGRLAGGVAHDFNNLLTIINGLGESLSRQVADQPAVAEDLRTILEAGRRAATLTRQLLAVSRRQLMEPTVLDLNTVVVEAESLLRRTISAHVAIAHDLAPELPAVRVDRGQLEQVIMNLVLNARDAMPDGGVITLTTAMRDVGAGTIPDVVPGGFVVLSVSDTGIGMTEDTLARVFEPFFTTKPLGQGTGLGLAMVQGIVSQSGGFVQAESQPGFGTTVHIGLPATHEQIASEETVPVEIVMPGSGTVLLVEDEDGVRRLTQRVLEANGYTVILADSGEAAMRLPAAALESVDLLLTDIMMPGMTGAELATALRRHHPDLPAIFMSGYASDALDVEHVSGRFLQKPFRIDDLSALVRTVLTGE